MSDIPSGPAGPAAANITPPATRSSADIATELVALGIAYKAANPSTSAYEMSPQEAEQRLQDMTKAYRESNKPQNSAADAAIVGDTPPREFETVTSPAVSTRSKLSAIEGFRDAGIPDAGIAKIVAGEPWDRADYEWALQWRRGLEHNPELRQLILSGDPEARRLVIGTAAIIAGGPKP